MKVRRTKIVCTIGPACCRRDALERLVRAGMDVARLNFSHGSHDTHAAAIGHLRHLSDRLNRPLPILQDLSGPKVRLGSFTAPSITLKHRDLVRFTSEACQQADCLDHLPLPVYELLRALRIGSILLLDDGKIEMKVTHIDDPGGSAPLTVRARVVAGGELKPHKGVTAPGLSFSLPAITDKDKDDLRFGLANGVDMVAASYVRSAGDMQALFDVMKEVGRQVPVIAKIEKFEAVRNLASILAVVDGIMVARGDLGVEMPFDEVPLVQKMIIKACNRAGKPVITATQMLESMMTCPRPTRAEATDVTNAIFDGTDAVMLSGETASGDYPDTAVKTMARIALRAESAFLGDSAYRSRLRPADDVTTAVARAAAEIADKVHASAILCATTSGNTARKVSQCRPSVPIVGVTTVRNTYRQLALIWGVQPCLVGEVSDTESMMDTTIAAARAIRAVKAGDQVVITSGIPVNSPGTTNMINVHVVGAPIRTPST